jgi:hypothetical protein
MLSSSLIEMTEDMVHHSIQKNDLQRKNLASRFDNLQLDLFFFYFGEKLKKFIDYAY